MKSERIFIAIVLLFVTVFTIGDIVSDVGEGASLAHLLAEGFVAALSGAGLIWIGSKVLNLKKQVIRQSGDIAEAQEEARRWKAETASLLAGLSQAIDLQFDRWQMTAAEKEVGLLLLKGLTLKEIAEIRSVSEKTVRAQSLAVYSKAGLSGRAELSAFFMEDILVQRA